MERTNPPVPSVMRRLQVRCRHQLLPLLLFLSFVLVASHLEKVKAFVIVTPSSPMAALRRTHQQTPLWPHTVALSDDDENDALESNVVTETAATTTTTRRRKFLATTAKAFLLSTTSMPFPMVLPANAAMKNSQSVFKVGETLGVDAAKARLAEARSSLQYLIDHYDDIVASGGGDGVRRYLGTVGTTSGLYGISKVLKELQEEANDIVEYTEQLNDFNYYLSAADTACYSANFVEFSAAKTKPEKFFQDARGDIAKMQTYLKGMAAELDL